MSRYRLSLPELQFLACWRADGRRPVPADVGLSESASEKLVNTLSDFGLIQERSQVGRRSDTPASPANDVRTSSEAGLGDDNVFRMAHPQVWAVEGRGLCTYDHDGRLVHVLTPAELAVAELFLQGESVGDAAIDAVKRGMVTTAAEVHRIARRLCSTGLLSEDRGATRGRRSGTMADIAESYSTFLQLRDLARGLEETRDAAGDAGDDRVKVHSMLTSGPVPPLSIGTVLSMAAVWRNEVLTADIDTYPRWIAMAEDAPEATSGPAFVLFSDYLWSHEKNLVASAAVKAANPLAFTVHGGPDCPAGEGDDQRYLEEHPHVDVVVRGEGEETFCEVLEAVGRSLRAGRPDPSMLASVLGITYRDGGEIVRNEARPRLVDLDAIPSPYLNGVFAPFTQLDEIDMAVVETNRGCPYGCVFCDWGSATNSRIRRFDLDRVYSELQWCAENRVRRLFIADANFGITSRDVQIAQRLADLHSEFGYPQRVMTNYAKNTVKYLAEIVRIWTRAGILSEGLLSLQSLDEHTLDVIRRKNIKLEKYESLAAEFRSEGLPLFVDLMMGLPGQSLSSLQQDLQSCVDREVLAKCHGTELLVNSPMNDPDYREEFAVEVSRPPGPPPPGLESMAPALVISTSTFTRDDYSEMHRMRRSFLLGENLGVLRFIGRLVRQETGVPEVEFIERIRRTATADSSRWAVLNHVATVVPDTMLPPGSWSFFVDELRDFLRQVIDMPAGSVLDTGLAVQHAMLPAPGRDFPYSVQLAHDFSRWHDGVLEQKLTGNGADWEVRVPGLDTFGPAELIVEDPQGVCRLNLGRGSAIDAYMDWELSSSVSRPTPGHHQIAERQPN